MSCFISNFYNSLVISYGPEGYSRLDVFKKKMKKSTWMFGFVIMSFYGFILFPVYAQEKSLEMNQPENWEEIAGKVENLNLDASMIVVKAYSDEGKAAYQEVPILITKEAKIVKNNQTFALKDLKTGDEVSVRYIVTASGQKAAYYLWVK